MADEPIYAKSLQRLRGMSVDDLVTAHDSLVERERYPIGPDYYLTELARRDADEQTRTMVEQTETMVKLTWAIAGFTVVNVAAVIYGIAN